MLRGILRLSRSSTQWLTRPVGIRGYAKKVAAAASSGPTLQPQRKRFPAETDPEKLATYCCGSNYRVEGEDVKLGPDEDYPDWLWTLHLGKPKLPCELDPNTEEYWETLHKNALYHQNKLRSKKPLDEIRINEKEKLAKLESIVHRALAHKYYDPGYDLDKVDRDNFRKFGPCARRTSNQTRRSNEQAKTTEAEIPSVVNIDRVHRKQHTAMTSSS